MKIKITIVVLLIVTIFNDSIFATQSYGVKNYFVNGVANTRHQTWESSKKLQTVSDVGIVGFLYNSTQNTAFDFIEAGIMSLKLDGFYNHDGSVNRNQTELAVLDSYFQSTDRNDNSDLVMYKLGRIYLDAHDSEQMKGFLKDLSIELTSRWSVYGYYMYSRFKNKHGYSYVDYINLIRIHTLLGGAKPVIVAYGNFLKTGSLKGIARAEREYLDLNEMILALSDDFGNNFKVNLVSHSQGNLYAVRLLDYFSKPGQVKHLSVATPADRVYGEVQDNGYVTIKEDLVSLVFFGALSRNGTNHPSEFWENIVSNIPIQKQIEIFNANKYQYIDEYGNVSGDATGHGFRESYLRNGTSSATFVSKKFQENFEELKYGTPSKLKCCLDIHQPPQNAGPEGKPKETSGDIYLSKASVSELIFKKGSRYKISVRQNYLGNVSNSELENVSLSYFLSKDNYYSDDDLKLGSDTSSIGSDDKYDNESLYWDIPYSLETSSYFIIFKSDLENQINEDDETNNTAMIAVAVY